MLLTSRFLLRGASLLLGLIVLSLTLIAKPVLSQGTPVVEAIKFANVRSGPGVNYPQVGTIYAGKTYPLVGRYARAPWYLIQLPDTQGWVYTDLVKVTGDPNSVPVTDLIIATPAPPTSTPVDLPAFTATLPVTAITATATVPVSTATVDPAVPSLTASPTATPGPSLTPTTAALITATLFSPTGVMAEAKDTANVRYGPGTDFPRIGTITKGQLYPVLRQHTLFPWLEIAFPGVASGRGWVYKDTVNVTGNLSTVPITSSREFGYPTLTPTQPMVVPANPPWTVTPSGATNPFLAKLSNDVYNYLLGLKFEPGTDQQGSVFLYDLRTGEAFSLNGGIAYSGMSLIKIPILVALFRKLDAPPTEDLAVDIGQMMVCSNNLFTNTVLSVIGDGDMYAGSAFVTDTTQRLGLKDTFLVGPIANDPRVTPQPIQTIKTGADQVSTAPDPYNQSSPASLGWLLSGIYQCAKDGDGPLVATFPGEMDANKCRKMLRSLSADQIGTMIEAGIPKTGVYVAHKHGWIDDTRGDAALILTPGGNYVLTVILHGKSGEFMAYDSSFPVISEVSRLVYNAYNPSQPLDKIHQEVVPEQCTLDPALINDLRASENPPIP